MRTWIRWTTGFAGLLITGIGLVATWNVLSPGMEGAPPSFDGWMFEGPALVTFGLLLLWTVKSAGDSGAMLDRRAPVLLLQIGLSFLVLPAATWIWKTTSGTEVATYAWTFTVFALGVPGVALALTGAALWLWRALRERGTD